MSKLTLPILLLGFSIAPAVMAQEEPPPPPPPVGDPAPPPPPAAAPATPAPAQPPPSYAMASAAAPDPTVRNHDGFYLRLGLGFGGMTLDRDSKYELTSVNGADINGESKISGGGGAFELSIGGTVGSGIVICGTLYTQSVQEAKLEPDEGDERDLDGNLNFVLLGPGIHWYPSPKNGFHIGLTLGVAAAVAKTPDGSRFENLGGVGGGGSLAVGYDFWIADQWSLGPMLRFTGANLHGEDKDGSLTAEEDDKLSAVSLMISGVFH